MLVVNCYFFVLIYVVPLLLFLTKFLSFYCKERKVLRKVPQSFICSLWAMLPISKEQEKMPGFTDST
ncbi:hypothetical protein C7N43_17645 [Sphingobacteriales bacterium UPWRP_1]|nr:hypothetical protein C7N43_17645 [Sphingobacteriales bacterium UPWRP_1]